MWFTLPPAGPEAELHPPTMTWEELNRLPNIRPFLGWTTFPYPSYSDWLEKQNTQCRLVYDRKPGSGKFELTGVINDGRSEGGWVSIDSCTLIMTSTRLRPGVYHHDVRDQEWKHYADPTEAPRPRLSYGFYRSVVDLGREAGGQTWNLLVGMREPLMSGDMRPGVLILARDDYEFAVPPGYRPQDVSWTKNCESSSLIKVGDYMIPPNGCLEFRDRIAHGIPEAPGRFEVLSGAGDGIYPISVIRDAEGGVICIKVCFDGAESESGDTLVQVPASDTVKAVPAPIALVGSKEEQRRRRRRSANDMLDIAKGFLRKQLQAE
uniref:Uncharacterized protein n=1 Tax=Mycena chlorophos TaxID=658473 RepID=A0ABQ0L6I5_MYCCL|nr:predicted protein [Mycena chlorophos]